MMALIKNSNNPQAMLQSIVAQNPRMQQIMTMINSCGGDPKTAFYNMAKSQGVDPNTIINMLKQ
jgi:hypothetical protein